MLKMTLAEYMDTQEWLVTRFQDALENGGLDVEVLFETLLEDAEVEGIEITDADSVDYDREIYARYYDVIHGLEFA